MTASSCARGSRSNPVTAALTAIANSGSEGFAIPTILEGIPLQIKHVNVTVDRPGFTFNPTDCEPLTLKGSLSSAEGATASLAVPFQVTDCAALAFKPVVRGVHRGAQHPDRWREPHYDCDLPSYAAGQRGEHRESQGEPAREAAGAPEDTAEGLPGKDVRGKPRELPRRREDR